MGRKPVLGLAGFVLAGVALLGCESSRSYTGSGPAGGAIGSAAPSQGWSGQTGVAGRQPTTTTPGTTLQQMPAGQSYGSSQPSTVGRPLNSPGGAGVGSSMTS